MMTKNSFFVSSPGVPAPKPRTDALAPKEEPKTAAHPKELKTFDLDLRPGFFDGTGGGIS